MATRTPVRSIDVSHQHDAEQGRGPHAKKFRPKAFDVLPEERTWWQRLVEQFNGNEGAGYAISFVVHAILLALLAIPVLKAFEPEVGFTTLLDNASDEQVMFDAPLDTLVAQPEESSSEENLSTQLLDPVARDQQFIPELKLDDKTSIKGEGNGTGSGGEFGGGRVAEPDNAIRVGNFSVWPWPKRPGLVNGEVQFGTPGEFPKVLQKYYVVIRIKVPEQKSFVRLSDYSGSVVGTDGYTQKIPEDVYYFRLNGEFTKARTTHRIPVIDGTAEILIEVPGAREAEVKDTIVVYSRILDEEQKIELVFQALE